MSETTAEVFPKNGEAQATTTATQQLAPMAPKTVLPFEPTNLDECWRVSAQLAKSKLLPVALQGKPEDVMVILMTGHELGLSPMQSIRGCYVIQGRAVTAADLAAALVMRSPACEYLTLVESTATKAVYETKRKGSPRPVQMTWTIEQARAAGLHTKDNWKNYPAAMLRARCVFDIGRAVYPDVLHGVYGEDEASSLEQARDITPEPKAPPTPPKNGASTPEKPQGEAAPPEKPQAEAAPAASEPEPIREYKEPDDAPTEAEQLEQALADAQRDTIGTVRKDLLRARDAGTVTAEEYKALQEKYEAAKKRTEA